MFLQPHSHHAFCNSIPSYFRTRLRGQCHGTARMELRFPVGVLSESLCQLLCVAYAVGEGGGCGGRTARNAANLIYSYCLVFSSSDSQTLCPTGFAIIALHLTAKWFPFPSHTHTCTYAHTARRTRERGKERERERVPLQERQRVRHVYFKSELRVRAQQVWA